MDVERTPAARFDALPDTDGPLCEAGWAVVSPLHLDPTAHDFLTTLHQWGVVDHPDGEACSTT